MLRSGKRYQPEMSEVVELLKAWKEEREEDKRRYGEEREETRDVMSNACRNRRIASSSWSKD